MFTFKYIIIYFLEKPDTWSHRKQIHTLINCFKSNNFATIILVKKILCQPPQNSYPMCFFPNTPPSLPPQPMASLRVLASLMVLNLGTDFSHHNVLNIVPNCCLWQQFISLYCWIVSHGIAIQEFVYTNDLLKVIWVVSNF